MVTQESIREFMKKNLGVTDGKAGPRHFTVSAKTGDNVPNLFYYMAEIFAYGLDHDAAATYTKAEDLKPVQVGFAYLQMPRPFVLRCSMLLCSAPRYSNLLYPGNCTTHQRRAPPRPRSPTTQKTTRSSLQSRIRYQRRTASFHRVVRIERVSIVFFTSCQSVCPRTRSPCRPM